jgi:N-acetylglutamate synthase-like GNAT family acetyltransferase
MSDFTLRAATEDDFPAIRRLIRLVGINPISLDWRRFLIAVDPSGRLLGCGQLKPHGKHVVELASIAVEPKYQRHGIASAIIDQLLMGAPRPLYLICRARLGPFYQKWGFRALEPREMPFYFRLLARLAGVFAPLAGEGGGLLVMKLM